MVNFKLVSDILIRLELQDFNFQIEKTDDFGDFVQTFCPELDFTIIKTKLITTKIFSEGIKDIGPDTVMLTLKGVEGGYNYFYDVKVYSGGAYGTRIQIGTKKIDYYTNDSEYIPCISFEMLKILKAKYEKFA
jgi:phosphosulfolactate synthase (CoM biosynthesis protein A)